MAILSERCPVVCMSRDDPTPPYREDGEGPFPRAWPAAAVVIPLDRDASAQATLFLLAAADLSVTNVIQSIPTASRFARECRIPARGHWINLTGCSLPVFILVYDSGGTAGENVEVFSRSLSFGFDWPDCGAECTQIHTFTCLLEAPSRLPPYVADTDGNGTLEILVASDATNSSGALDTPQIYDVWAWGDGQFNLVGQLAADEIKSLVGRVAL